MGNMKKSWNKNVSEELYIQPNYDYRRKKK